ncbi:unnamed protein product [Moneuplotes crassus]|uniref:Amino acid transporter transmembrane domain-containing protein n=1 Tax=Euplotes crassus TaxID=5936 RepID=A0AAD1U8I4_EUPCR|nr:unnamed protein product [Moneuplotes crassus]
MNGHKMGGRDANFKDFNSFAPFTDEVVKEEGQIALSKLESKKNCILNGSKEENSFCASLRKKISFKQGGMKGSFFNLIACTLGIGTTVMPYLALTNGIILSSLFTICGAYLCYFCGMLLVSCAEKTGMDKYEEFTSILFGRNISLLVGWFNTLTLLGYVTSSIVFLKSLIPHVVDEFIGLEQLPEIMNQETYKGQIFWAALYTVMMLLPLSLPRKIGVLRFNAMFGAICTFYLIICITLMLFDAELVPNIGEAFNNNIVYVKFTFEGIADGIPFAVFAFMYQQNVPIIYRELNQKSYRKMSIVMISGTTFATFLYIVVSICGYLEIVGDQAKIEALRANKSILEVPFDKPSFKVAKIALMLTVACGTPLCVLPAKDAFEEIYVPGRKLSFKQNIFTTLVMLLGCFLCAVLIPNIGDAITIFGCTLNPLMGFILPAVFYLKIVEDEKKCMRISCYAIIIFITCLCCWIFYKFCDSKLQ